MLPHQPPAPDVLTLRAILANLLSAHLGSFSTGVAGLWVEPPNIPSASSAKGVICVISRDKQPGRSEAAGEQVARQFFWEVRVTNYGSSPGDRVGKTQPQIDAIEAIYEKKMDEVLALLRLNFPLNRERISPQSSETFRQSTFLLQYNELLNPRW